VRHKQTELGRVEGLTDPTPPLRVSTRQDGVGAASVALPEALRLRTAVQRERGRDWLLHRVLLLADVLGLSLAFVTAQVLFPPGHTRDLLTPGWEAFVFIAVLPVWVVIGMLSGLYGRDHTRADHSTVDDFVGVFAVVTIGSWIYSAIAWLTHAVSPNPPRMVTFWGLAIAFVVIARVIGRAAARRSPLYPQRALILGTGDVGQLIARKLARHPEYAINLVGFVDGDPKALRRDLAGTPLLGSPERLLDIVRQNQVDRVIVAYSGEPDGVLLGVVNRLRATSVHIDIVPRLFDAVGPKVTLHTVETLPLLGLPPVRLTPSERMAKRLIDLVVSVFLLVLLAPLFAYIAWRVKRDSPGPVFFRQERLGLNMVPFTVLKFRTMREGVDDDVHREYIKTTTSATALAEDSGLYKLSREDAVTESGRWLRRLSLDELPQLINIVKGEMSLVGPRPCIAYETEHFSPQHFERFLVMPGMTGLWQVAARARSSFGEALGMDVAYARGWSLALDLRLLCQTPIALIRQGSTEATT
jgi:exopolysaccharide biosynthesis polyprenyl glycosylphosphotransferase